MKIEKKLSTTTNAPAFFVQGHEFQNRSGARKHIQSLKPAKTKVPPRQGDWYIPGKPVDGVTLGMAIEAMTLGDRVQRGA